MTWKVINWTQFLAISSKIDDFRLFDSYTPIAQDISEANDLFLRTT